MFQKDNELILNENRVKRFFEEKHRIYLFAAVVALLVVIVVVIGVVVASDVAKDEVLRRTDVPVSGKAV